MRRVVPVVALGLLLVPAAAAKNGVRARLTHPLPKGASAGTKVVVSFTLRDAAGHPFGAQRVFVKITRPEGTDSTVASATNVARGAYRAVALVPPGGIGAVRIGLRGSSDVYFPLTNRERLDVR